MRVTKYTAAFSGETNKTPLRSEGAREVARLFGLTSESRPQSRQRQPAGQLDLPLAGGTITLITGGSGGGKSTLLRSLRQQRARHDARCRRWIDLMSIRAPRLPIVDCLGDDWPVVDRLRLLSRVGLGEAWSYLRLPSELSDGQRFRFRLAMGIRAAERVNSARPRAAILACDEFAAVLDRLTAMIVARCLRKTIDALPGLAAVVATSHDDLDRALRPDVIVRCDFGAITVERGPHPEAAQVDIIRRQGHGR